MSLIYDVKLIYGTDIKKFHKIETIIFMHRTHK